MEGQIKGQMVIARLLNDDENVPYWLLQPLVEKVPPLHIKAP